MGSRTERSLENLEVKHTRSNLIKCVPLGKGSQALLEGGRTWYLYQHIISQQAWLEMQRPGNLGHCRPLGPGLAGTVQGLDSGILLTDPWTSVSLPFRKGEGLDV